MDSDALGLALSTHWVAIEEASTPPFRWSDYTDLEARYDFTALASMWTSNANSFNGGNYLETDTAAATSAGFSVLGWVKSGDTAEQTALWIGNKDTADEWVRIGIDSAGDAFLGRIASAGSEDVTTGANIDDDAWHFLGAVHTGIADVDLYVDAAAAVNDTTSVAVANFDRTTIGAAGDSSRSAYWIGELDNFYVFNAVLTTAEVAYMRTNKPTYAQLVTQFAAGASNCPDPDDVAGYWGLDERSGLRKDGSGSGIHLSPSPKLAVKFESDDSEYATGANVASDYPLSVVANWKTSGATSQGLFQVGEAGVQAWLLFYVGDDGKLKSDAYQTGTPDQNLVVSVATDAADNTWHWGGVVWGSSTNSDHKLYFDDAAAVAGAGDTVTITGTYDHSTIGRRDLATPDLYFDGAIDEVGVWAEALSDGNMTWLRTGGIRGGPVAYADVVNSGHADNPGTTNLLAWYSLRETDPSGGNTLVNVHNPGTYDLTTASGGSGPTSVVGVVDYNPVATEGTVEAVTTVEDTAANFPTINSYMEAASAPISAFPFSMAVWVKGEILVANGFPMSLGLNAVTHAGIRVDQDGTVRMVSGSLKLVPAHATNVLDDEWHLVVAVWTDATTRGISVDGSAFTTDSTSYAFPTGVTHVAIGRLANSGSAFVASVDEAMLFSSALSATDASELYNAGVGVLARGFDSDTLTSGKTPLHGWSCSETNEGGDFGRDMVRTGTPIDLTATSSPNQPVRVDGIPAGQVSGLVFRVDDQTANDNDLTQSDFDKRPEVVRVTDGTGYALQFDVVDDYLQSTAFGSALSQPNDIFATADFASATGGLRTLYDGLSSSTHHRLYSSGGNSLIMITNAAIVDGAVTTSLETTLAVWNTTSSALYRDGGAASTTGNVGTQTLTGITVGAEYNGLTPAGITVRQLVINDGALTTAERNAIGGQLADDHGLSWSAIA